MANDGVRFDRHMSVAMWQFVVIDLSDNEPAVEMAEFDREEHARWFDASAVSEPELLHQCITDAFEVLLKA